MDLISLEETIRHLPLGEIRYYQKIDSTNDIALEWANRGAKNLSLVIANEQTQGRGRLGRTWFTPASSAIACSIILKDILDHRDRSLSLDREVENTGERLSLLRLTALGTLAVSNTLSEYYQLNPKIKWPNDVLIGGRKIAGVLAEVQWNGDEFSTAIIGIGVNVYPSSVPPSEMLAFPATCVANELGKNISRVDLLKIILEQFVKYERKLFSASFVEAWNENLAFKGEYVEIIHHKTTQENDVLFAKIEGVTPQGYLKIVTKSGEEKILKNGEISLRKM
jgi:BirA family transcriptional regulator, biotin operon repressor / biotin---[acetyl-CoA-carboxylase] ligase